MAWFILSITKPHLVYILLGAFTSIFMLCSSIIKERMYIGEATVATIFGLIFGPNATNLINPESWGSTDIVTIEFSRIVLVVQCFAVGVELPKYYMEKHWKSVTLLLIPVMIFGWLVTSVFIWALFRDLSWLESLVIAACVTATDPVLASSVVGKGKFAKRVPKHLRDLLSAESGCNDGMAFPFLYLALWLIHDHMDGPSVTKHWFVYTLLYGCIFGAIYGFIVGYVSRRSIRYAEEHDLIDRESFLVFYFVLALFCAGSGSLLGLDDLLVGFAAGVGFSNDGWFSQRTEESSVSNVIDLLLNLTYFVYLGTIIPWTQFNNHELGLDAWRLVLLALAVIFFRRIPIMLALKPFIPDIKTWREALFAGHFGPIGVGAIFVAMLARAELEAGDTVPLAILPPSTTHHYHLIVVVWPIVTFLVVASIVVHGSSVAVFTLGKRINTLTLTMSYTVAREDGPGWKARLPKISSISKSQSKSMSSLRNQSVPPGTLPPIGLAGSIGRTFSRHKSDTDGNETTSILSRRKKNKEYGGPVSQSAIFPAPRPATDTAQTSDQEEVSPEEAAAHDRVIVYDEGDHFIMENEDGDVLGVTPTHRSSVASHRSRESLQEAGLETGQASSAENADSTTDKPAVASRPATAGSDMEWTYNGLKRRLTNVINAERDKRKAPDGRSSEPARAYQYGGTIVIENEDGDVIKTYQITPTRQSSQKQTGGFWGRGLKAMGFGSKESESAKGKTVAGMENRTPTELDDGLRFTVGGIGTRMKPADFLAAVQGLDSRSQAKALEEAQVLQVPQAAKQRKRNSYSEGEGNETAVERRRRLAALESTNNEGGSGDAEPSTSAPPPTVLSDSASPAQVTEEQAVANEASRIRFAPSVIKSGEPHPE